MFIIVVGCGRVGSELAYRLYQRGHKVTVIDNQVSAFHNLHPEFRGRTVEGEAMNQEVLSRAGIQEADGLAAVTTSDSLNIVVAHIARTTYQLPNVIVRNFDPRWRLLYEVFNLQVISSSSWGAQRIEELLYHREMRTVFSAGNGEVEVYEFTIPRILDGRKLGDLMPPKGCVLSALTRAGRALLPHQDTELRESDIVLVSATFDGIAALRRALREAEEA
jgi:trk system potassium uptake protein